jgi:hypothetical protein
MATFKERIEDLAGTIPATADGEQFVKDGADTVKHRILALAPGHADLFTETKVVADGGTSIDNTHIFGVHRDSSNCRFVPSGGRHSTIDTGSMFYATSEDPAYYVLDGKIYVKPAGGTTVEVTLSAHGTVSNWDTGSSAISNFPEENYYQVIMYAALQVLYHKMVETAMPTDITLETIPSLSLPLDLPNAPVAPPLVSFSSFNSIGNLSVTAVPPEAPVLSTTSALSFTTAAPVYTQPSISGGGAPDDLSDMVDSDWASLDFDFDDENIDFSTWFQTAGDMIQNQEDVEIASMQLQKIASYVNAYSVSMQNRLNAFNDANTEYQAEFQRAVQNAGLEGSLDGRKLSKYQAELGQYQQEVNAQIGEYTQNLGKAMQAWGGEQQNQLGLYGANLQKYQSKLGASNQEVGTKISEYTQNLQNIAQKNSALLQDFGSKIQKVSGEYQWLQGQISMLKQQFNESFGLPAGGR